MRLQRGDKGSLVITLQSFLKGLDVDGDFGPNTENGVKSFQEKTGLEVDGVFKDIDADFIGWEDFKYFEKRRDGRNKSVCVLLPECGVGFETYNREPRNHPVGIDQFGTQESVDTLIELGIKWHQIHPDSPILIGDGSYLYGADTPDHATHQSGREWDFRLFRTDKKNASCVYTWKTYDQALQREWLEFIRKEASIVTCYFNDPDLVRAGLCRPKAGHDNHVHLVFKR